MASVLPESRVLPEGGVPLHSDESLFAAASSCEGVITTSRGAAILRRVRPMDAWGIEEFVRRLSPTSRFRRFHAPVEKLTDKQLEGIVDVDHRTRETLVAEHRGRVIGMAQYIEIAPGTVELAVAVSDSWHRQGVGRALLARAVSAATANGYRTAVAYAQADNRPILDLLRTVGLPVCWELTGATVEATLALTGSWAADEDPAAWALPEGALLPA